MGNIALRDRLAREIFEHIKPTNPHGPQDDLYFGMPFCSYQTKQAIRMADELTAKFSFVQDNPRRRALLASAREHLVARMASPNRAACNPSCPPESHEHPLTADEELIVQLAGALEDSLPTAEHETERIAETVKRIREEQLQASRDADLEYSTQGIQDAIQLIRERTMRGERDSISFDTDDIGPATDIDGNPIDTKE